jgi:hypothetical protein
MYNSKPTIHRKGTSTGEPPSHLPKASLDTHYSLILSAAISYRLSAWIRTISSSQCLITLLIRNLTLNTPNTHRARHLRSKSILPGRIRLSRTLSLPLQPRSGRSTTLTSEESHLLVFISIRKCRLLSPISSPTVLLRNALNQLAEQLDLRVAVVMPTPVTQSSQTSSFQSDRLAPVVDPNESVVRTLSCLPPRTSQPDSPGVNPSVLLLEPSRLLTIVLRAEATSRSSLRRLLHFPKLQKRQLNNILLVVQ